MTGILDKFHVEHSVHGTGTRLMARTLQVTGELTDDKAIDAAITMLKDDLDACGREMKRLNALDRRGSLFEGWPSATDDVPA